MLEVFVECGFWAVKQLKQDENLSNDIIFY